jgi:hypothetical protein
MFAAWFGVPQDDIHMGRGLESSYCSCAREIAMHVHYGKHAVSELCMAWFTGIDKIPGGANTQNIVHINIIA